jgi:hypothetical protein
MVDETIYAAKHEYISRSTDAVPNQAYLGTLEKAFRVDRSVIGSNRVGQEVTIGLGEVTLSNKEHDYDGFAVDRSAVGGDIEIRHGDLYAPMAEWHIVMVGNITSGSVDRDRASFSVRDRGYQLDVPASPNVYAGTGGKEGGDDLKGKRKPRYFGWNENVKPPLVIPSAIALQVNDGPIQSVSAVYVRGVPLSPWGNYLTVEEMNAASITAGFFATCLQEGWIRVAVANDTELGEITCDFAGDNSLAYGFVETAADIVKVLMLTATDLTAADIDQLTFDAVNAEQPAPIGFPIAAGSDETVRSACARIMASVGGWLGPRRSGIFEVHLFDAPSGTASGEYDKTNVKDVSTQPLPGELATPPYRVRIGWSRNQTPGQTNLAGSVTEERRAYLAEEFRFATAEDLDNITNYPPGHELVEDDTFFRDEADALAEAERKLALFGIPRRLYTFRLTQPLFIHEVGQTVRLTFPSLFDLNDGKLLRIVRLSEDDTDGVEITAFG